MSLRLLVFQDVPQLIFFNVHGNDISRVVTTQLQNVFPVKVGIGGEILYVTPKSLQTGSLTLFSLPSGIFSLMLCDSYRQTRLLWLGMPRRDQVHPIASFSFLLPAPHFPGHFFPTHHMMHCSTRWDPWGDVIYVATYSVSSFPVPLLVSPYVGTPATRFACCGEEMNVYVPFLNAVVLIAGELAGVHRADR
jgi:hypothetical protein